MEFLTEVPIEVVYVEYLTTYACCRASSLMHHRSNYVTMQLLCKINCLKLTFSVAHLNFFCICLFVFTSFIHAAEIQS